MDLYLGIGDMPIYNFDKVLNTNNMAYLVVGWNERKEIEVPKEASERWDSIYNEYCIKTENNEALTFYSLSAEIGYLETRYMAVFSLINNLCEAYKEEIGLRLNKWGIPFNIKGKISEQLPLLQRHLRIAAQKIEMRQDKLNALKGDEDEERASIMKQKIKLERVTGLKIDLKTTSVEEWVEIYNESKEIIQQRKAS